MERIRILNGCDGEYYCDFREPIEEEKYCYRQVIKNFSEKEKTEILDNDDKDGLERHLTFESQCRVPFELFKNVYGKTIEQVDEENKNLSEKSPEAIK